MPTTAQPQGKILSHNVRSLLEICTREARRDIESSIEAFQRFVQMDWGDEIAHQAANNKVIENPQDGDVLVGFYGDIVIVADIKIRNGAIHLDTASIASKKSKALSDRKVLERSEE